MTLDNIITFAPDNFVIQDALARCIDTSYALAAGVATVM